MSVNVREFENFIYKETVSLDPGVLVNCYRSEAPSFLGKRLRTKWSQNLWLWIVTYGLLICFLFFGFFGDFHMDFDQGSGGEFSVSTFSRSPRAPVKRSLSL